MLPFSRADFFALFARYNEAIWPAAIAAYPLAIAATILAFRPRPGSGPIVAAILALMWGWAAIFYHGLFFTRINPAAIAFAGAFAAEALLLAAAAARGWLEFGPPGRLRAAAGGAMIGYAMIAYPLIGLLAGEIWPALPLFGITPCPLLIFTFGLMTLATRASWWLWVVPLLWSAIGGSAAILLAVPQDWGLPLSAIVALGVSLRPRVRNGDPRLRSER